MSRTDLAVLVYLGAVWGGAYLFVRIAAPAIGPVWTAELRIAIAAAALLAVAGRPTLAAMRGNARRFVVVGAAFSAIPFTLIAFASVTLPAGLGAVLNASTPLFTAVVGAAWIGNRLGMRTVIGLVLGVTAVVVLVGWAPVALDVRTLVAAAAALTASLSYAFAGLFVRRYLPTVNGREVATGQLAIGAVLVLPFAILSGPLTIPSIEVGGAVVGLAVLSTALAWPLFFGLLRRTGATVAMTVTFIVPAFAIVWGAIVLGEHVGVELLVGFGLIAGSLALIGGLRLPRLPRLPRLSIPRPAAVPLAR
jgi:drug/metabolite transporter (DMT)-like permease